MYIFLNLLLVFGLSESISPKDDAKIIAKLFPFNSKFLALSKFKPYSMAICLNFDSLNREFLQWRFGIFDGNFSIIRGISLLSRKAFWHLRLVPEGVNKSLLTFKFVDPLNPEEKRNILRNVGSKSAKRKLSNKSSFFENHLSIYLCLPFNPNL